MNLLFHRATNRLVNVSLTENELSACAWKRVQGRVCAFARAWLRVTDGQSASPTYHVAHISPSLKEGGREREREGDHPLGWYWGPD